MPRFDTPACRAAFRADRRVGLIYPAPLGFPSWIAACDVDNRCPYCGATLPPHKSRRSAVHHPED